MEAMFVMDFTTLDRSHPPPLNEISGPANGKQVCVYIYIFVGLSLYFSAQSALMDKEILYTDY